MTFWAAKSQSAGILSTLAKLEVHAGRLVARDGIFIEDFGLPEALQELAMP